MKKEAFNEEIQFEFLATMRSVELSIIHVVRIHEEYYYQKAEISNSLEFLKKVKSWIQTSIIKGELVTNVILKVIKKFEDKFYHDNIFKIFDTEESICGIIDDLISLINVAIYNKTIISIRNIEEECQHLLENINDSWIYREGYNNWLEINMTTTITNLNEILHQVDKSESPWVNEEDLILDLEGYVGKVWDIFSYSDKLTAFNYIQQLSFLQKLTGKQREDLLDQLHNFLGL